VKTPAWRAAGPSDSSKIGNKQFYGGFFILEVLGNTVNTSMKRTHLRVTEARTEPCKANLRTSSNR
jgi:hypothetical protein